MVLLWAGAGVAPSAAALLVVGSSGGLLRAGAVLSMFSVMLVAFGAIYSRGGGSAGGADGYTAEEVGALRQEVRADINHAARVTHRQLAEKIIALSDTVEALRGQIEVLRAHAERSHLAAPGVQHTETVQVTRQTYASAGYGSRGEYGSPRGEYEYGPARAAYGSAAVPGNLRAEPGPPPPPSAPPSASQERYTGSWTDQRLSGYGSDPGPRTRERPDDVEERSYGGRRSDRPPAPADPYGEYGGYGDQGRVTARAALPATGSGEPVPSWAVPGDREREREPYYDRAPAGAEYGRRARRAPEGEWR